MCTRRITMQPRARRQRQLFEEPPAAPAVRLPLDVQEQLRQALVHLDALPKFGSARFRFGPPKTTRFSRLKYDMRNSAFTCSPMPNFLLRETFSFRFHGPRISRTRGAVPSTQRPGLVKAAAFSTGCPV